MQFDGYEDTSHMFKLDIRNEKPFYGTYKGLVKKKSLLKTQNEKNDIFFIFITANNLL